MVSTVNIFKNYIIRILSFLATIKDNIRVSVTLNTNELNCNKLMASLPNSESVHC